MYEVTLVRSSLEDTYLEVVAPGMSAAAVTVARHVLQESVRRRVFTVVLALTLAFLALFVIATVEAFNATAPFGARTGLINTQQVTTVTLLGLGVFASLFLATVLAVFLTLGAVRGDAERGLLQPLVVRPLGRWEFLLGRFIGAAVVCVAYIVGLYVVVVLIVHQVGGSWPDEIIVPALALAAGITILVAMSLLGSIHLSATANGIAMFMLYGAGLVSGLLATIGAVLNAHTVTTIARDMAIALPVRRSLSGGAACARLHQTGLSGVLVNLGPFGSSHPASAAFDLWSAAYLVLVALLAQIGFARRDL